MEYKENGYIEYKENSILVSWHLRWPNTWPKQSLHLISCLPIHPLQTYLSWQLILLEYGLSYPCIAAEVLFYFFCLEWAWQVTPLFAIYSPTILDTTTLWTVSWTVSETQKYTFLTYTTPLQPYEGANSLKKFSLILKTRLAQAFLLCYLKVLGENLVLSLAPSFHKQIPLGKRHSYFLCFHSSPTSCWGKNEVSDFWTSEKGWSKFILISSFLSLSVSLSPEA